MSRSTADRMRSELVTDALTAAARTRAAWPKPSSTATTLSSMSRDFTSFEGESAGSRRSRRR
ncbi:hypothetical protein [Streptomyces sp. 6N223]|uniref:hypothetical protein n=1 Tax=Streptomyces sp. 6N223 TaxID=3457412 RepID=UPI003FD09E96